MGPSTLPGGTPLETAAYSDVTSPIVTFCNLPEG